MRPPAARRRGQRRPGAGPLPRVDRGLRPGAAADRWPGPGSRVAGPGARGLEDGCVHRRGLPAEPPGPRPHQVRTFTQAREREEECR